MTITDTILVVVWFAYILIRGKSELHMMQLNSYMNVRYLRWLFTKYFRTFAFIADIIAVCLFVLLIAVNMRMAVFLIATIYLGYNSIKLLLKKEKKKLVFTHRAIRLYISLIIISLAFILILLYLNNNIACLFISLTPLTIIVFFLMGNILSYPIENTINSWYIYDAKKKINNYPNLVKIAITGSYGKTSTKYFLKKMLTESFNTLATPESFNTPMGIAKTIRMSLRPTDEIFIAEMGAKNIYDIKELCEIVKPRYGIITAVGEQHLETFKTVDNVLKTKFELLENLEQGGTLLINKDFPVVKKAINRGDINIFYYSVEDINTDFNSRNIVYSSKGLKFDIYEKNKFIVKMETKLIGRFNVSNILGAAALAYLLKTPIDNIRSAVKKLEPVPHRLEVKITQSGVTIIDDAFNSNPYGAQMALEALEKIEGNKKIIVTPGMVELGDKEYKSNYEFGQRIADVCELVVLVGKYQTKAILDGLNQKKYDRDKIVIVNTIDEASRILEGKIEKGNVLLYENDLPDTYIN